ncbi:MAG: hypothetical protein R3Y40_06490 [Eubacteriales bacterium]
MTQLRLIVKRLRKPSVIASLTSQIITMLVLLGIEINTTLVTSVISCLTSIFIILGIFSNPDAKRRGYRDDISPCTKCNGMTQHVMVADEMVCTICGCSSNDLSS